MRFCGLQAFAEIFATLDSFSEFILAGFLVLLLSTVFSDISQWWSDKNSTKAQESVKSAETQQSDLDAVQSWHGKPASSPDGDSARKD